MISIFFALAVAATTAKPAPTPAKASVMTVRVETPAPASAAAQGWAQELRAAIEARKADLRTPKPGENPDLTVRIDAVQTTADGRKLTKLTLLQGKNSRSMDFYPSGSDPAPTVLARNLRQLAAQMLAAPASK